MERWGRFVESSRMKLQNLVGPQVRKLRYNRGWSQAHLAMQLQLEGLDVGREVVAQIEGQTHCVKDSQLLYFSTVFGIEVIELYPHFPPGKPIHDYDSATPGRRRSGCRSKSCNEIITTLFGQNW